MSSRRSAAVATAVTAAVATVLTGCGSAARPVAQKSPPPVHFGANVRLVAFDSCDALVKTLRSNALKQVTAYGLGMQGVGYAEDVTGLRAPMAAGPATVSGSVASSAGSGAAKSFSGTNNQEEGVDEPDLAKTDGHVLVVTRQDRFGIELYDVSGDSPKELAFEPLTQMAGQAQLFLLDSLVVAIGPSSTGGANGEMATKAVVVDIANPSAPQVVRTFRVPGGEVDARLIGDRVVLVMRSQPQLPMRYPSKQGDEPATLKANKQTVSSAGVDAWLPAVTTTPSNKTFRPGCDHTWHDASNADTGVQTLSVVSLDPAHEDSVQQTTVVGTAGTVYASATSVYVASGAWWRYGGPVPMPMGGPAAGVAVKPGFGGGGSGGDGGTTQVYGFDLSNPADPRYLGAGAVPGQLTDQYAMSENDGYLRVATTVGMADPAPGEGQAPKQKSDSRVTVLQPQHGALVPVGTVKGLGRGEKIYGVRFLGDLGYVVTFRQIDPLYVLDLSDPRNPREVSHLEVTGYSAYLHPLGDGLLLGLGREVDRRAHPIGEQLSTFDVTSPANPKLRDRVYRDGASSPAEDDHHAFLWWAQDRVAVVPMSGEYGGEPTVMAVYGVGTDGAIAHRGDVVLPSTGGPERWVFPERSLVVGDVLYTVSNAGLLANRLHGLERVAWLPFG